MLTKKGCAYLLYENVREVSVSFETKGGVNVCSFYELLLKKLDYNFISIMIFFIVFV